MTVYYNGGPERRLREGPGWSGTTAPPGPADYSALFFWTISSATFFGTSA
jgi:hypothetical protein